MGSNRLSGVKRPFPNRLRVALALEATPIAAVIYRP